MTNTNCTTCRKKMLQRLVFVLLDIRPSELAAELNISRGHMSNLLGCKRQSEEFDSWLVGRLVELISLKNVD